MVSKRLRFEILRRDNFRCVYCGATPAESELHVDHVVPRTLGGQDTAENLATSCQSCNAGKSSMVPSSEMVAAVNEALAIEQAARARASEIAVDLMQSLDEYEDEVRSIWEFHVPEYRRARVAGWDLAKIDEWHRDGVPATLIEFGLRLAVQADIPWDRKAGYAVAVVRNKMQEARNGAD